MSEADALHTEAIMDGALGPVGKTGVQKGSTSGQTVVARGDAAIALARHNHDVHQAKTYAHEGSRGRGLENDPDRGLGM